MQFYRSSFFAALAAVVLLGVGCSSGSSAQNTAGGVWMSQNFGGTWSAKNTLPLADGTGTLANVDVRAFSVDPSDDDVFYVGTQASGLFSSLDAGATWSRVTLPSTSGAILDVAVSAADVCTYYVLRADRLLKTTTCGREFDDDVYVEGREKEALTALALDWYNSNIIYLGTTAGEILKSSDAGATWTSLFSVKDSISSLLISNADSRVVIAGGARTGIYRSEDGGVSWESFEDMLDAWKNADRVFDLAQSAAGERIVASTKYGLITSTDDGVTWDGIALLTAAGDVTITSLAVHPRESDLFAYGTNAALYLTKDGGSTWATEELPTSRIASTLTILEDNTFFLGLFAPEE